MPDNLPNIVLPINQWVDLYALSGIEVGTAVSIENIGSCDIYLAVQATQPDPDHDSYNIVQRNNGLRVQNNQDDAGIWAFCNSAGAKLSIAPASGAGVLPHASVLLKDEYGQSLQALRRALNINPISNFKLEVARGNVPGASFYTIVAIRRDVPISAYETISPQGGVYPFPATAAQRTVVSTSANDTAAGTGARTVYILGLDADYNEINETLTLNGTTPVTTANSYLRINGFRVLTSGTLKINDGDIDILNGTDVLGRLEAEQGFLHQSVYTVPAGKTAYLTNLLFTSGSGDEAEVIAYADFGGIGTFIAYSTAIVYQGVAAFTPENYFPTIEFTDIDYRAKKTLGVAGRVTMFAEFLLIDNEGV